MHLKGQNYDVALESYKQAIKIYGKTENEEIMEQVFWARYQSGVINATKGDEQQALNIYAELMELRGYEEKLWKKLATEKHRSISSRIQVFNLCYMVDSPVHYAGHSRPSSHYPDSCTYDRNNQ